MHYINLLLTLTLPLTVSGMVLVIACFSWCSTLFMAVELMSICMVAGTAGHSRDGNGDKATQRTADRTQPPSTLSPLQAGSVYTQSKPSPSSTEIMRNRMAFFSVPSQPVRINAKAFLGLEAPPPSVPLEEQEVAVTDVSKKPPDKEEMSTDLAKEEPASKEPDGSRKRHGRREPAERAKRWRKRRKKRRVTGHVTGAAVAEKHGALPVVSIEGASSDEDGELDLVNTGDSIVDRDGELSLEKAAAADVMDESKCSAQVDAGNDEQLETDSSSALHDDSHLSLGEEVPVLEDHQQPEDMEEASTTVCDAADDLSESESEIADELCVNSDEDNENEDVNGTEYLIDGRTINYDKLFAEDSEDGDKFEVDLCPEEQQQVVDSVVSSFQKVMDAQPSADTADADLPLTQSEERLLMFGWKEGMEDDNDDGDKVPEMNQDTTDKLVRNAGSEITFEAKDDVIKASDAADRDSVNSSTSSGLSESKRSYLPPTKSPDQTAIALAPIEKLAPRADVDSFSDEDLELCVEVPSYSPTDIKLASNVADTAVENIVPAVDTSVASGHCDDAQNLDTSSNLDSLVATNATESVNLSDVSNISSDVYQQTEVSTTELAADIDENISGDKSAQLSMQSLPQDLNGQSVEATDFVPLDIDVEETRDIVKKDVSSPRSPIASLSADSSQVAKLDPVARIDRLLESLSSSRIGPVSPSLLRCDDSVFQPSKQVPGKPEVSSDLPEAQHSDSPFSRLDRLADSSVIDRRAETSGARDDSHIVEFTVEDQSGAELSFRVDESFVSTRDKRQQQYSEKESLSDVSFSATDSAADHSLTYRNADESSSSGTREVATCPAALMATTDDSLSLDRLASFSFDDILSVDNVDGEDSQDQASMEAVSDQPAVSKPVCNGTLHGEVDFISTQPQSELHAVVVDAAAGKDSPHVAVVSPSRLVDAKRRFFCEPPQPVRIDPWRVFDEIPAKPLPRGASADQTSKPQRVNGLFSEVAGSEESSSDQPRRRVLPALPSDELPLDTSQLVLSVEEMALIKKSQQRSAQSGEKTSPTAADDATLVRRRPHRAEKKRPSSALVVTATEREKMGSCGPSPQTVSAVAKPSAVRQSSYSDSTTDGSPSQRRDRIWAFHRSKSSKTKAPLEQTGSGDTENSTGSDRKDKKRSLLALLMPSKSVDRRIKTSKDMPPVSSQPSAPTEPSIDRTEMIAAIREKTKSLPLEKKRLPSVPASDMAKRSSLEKQRSKSSKVRGSKKSESEGDGRSKQPQRTVYEEMAPIIEGIKRVERRNRDKVNIHDRIRAVAPPPAKAPFTALLPPKADSKFCCNFSLTTTVTTPA